MKRLFTLLLCALLLLGAVPAWAAGGETVYLRTKEDLRALAENCTVDSYSAGKTFVLAADVDLGGEEFAPIPVFAGHFDGGGRTIRGLKLSKAASVTGFFRYLTETALVERLYLEGEVCPEGEAKTVGGIAGENHGTVRGCGFTGTVRGSRAVGGLVGLCGETGLLEGCTAAGLVLGEHGVGGVAGECAGFLRSCVSYAEVNTQEIEISNTQTNSLNLSSETFDLNLAAETLLDVTDVGGVVGFCSGALQGCANAGKVGYPHVGYNVGGVAGRLSGTAENCLNRGEVFGRKDVGGVVGQLSPAAFWSFAGSKLEELRGLLDGLQTATDRLLNDTGAQNAAMSASLSAALEALSDTGAAAQALSEETRSWLSGSMDTVNALSSRMTQTTEDLVPVFSALEKVTAALPDTLRELRSAEDALVQAYAAAPALPGSAQAAEQDLEAALGQAAAAAASFSAAVAQLCTAAGDPADVAAGVAQLSGGLQNLSTVYTRIAEDLELINDGVEDLIDSGYATPELLQLLANLRRIPDDLLKSAQAIAQLTGGLAALGGAMDVTALGSAISSLSGGLSALSAMLRDTQDLLSDLSVSAAALRAAKPELTTAAQRIEDAAASAQLSLDALSETVNAASKLLQARSGDPALALAPIGTHSAAEESLFGALQDTNAALSRLSGEVRDTAMLADIRAVSDQLFALTDYFVGLYETPTDKNLRDYVEDVSETEEASRGGLVQSCRSEASVRADTNVGGVVGAVTLELDFDREDEWNVSGALSGGMRYLIYAVVRGCASVGEVDAKKEAAGGIVGRMDYGAVLSCEASGAASAGGSYAGGVAGYCLGTIRGSLARMALSAQSYVGGIAGLAHNLYDCRSLPQSLPEAEFRGAVAGSADGTVAGNLYAECAVGAVNGLSFAGQAEPVGYDALLASAGESDLFRTITVQFLTGDGVYASVEVPFGGRVEQLPAVPDKDGSVWQWEDFDNTAIYRSLSVGGAYVSPAPTLSTGGELPLCLVEGSFAPGQTLRLEPYAGAAGENTLAAYTVTVTDCEGSFSVRLRQPEEGRLCLVDADGALREVQYTRDGSYIVFPMENGGSFVLTAREKPIWPYLALGGVGVAALGTGGGLLLRRRKKKPAQV